MNVESDCIPTCGTGPFELQRKNMEDTGTVMMAEQVMCGGVQPMLDLS